jgi:Uma2 family endonuclease
MPLAKKIKKIYTYKDYLTWPDDIRCELIDGVIYDMTPAPIKNHQKISMELSGRFWGFLKGKPCEVYHALFDVRLSDGNEDESNIKTVVQPDIAVICDKKKLDEKGCVGAPDLIVEIASPATASKDLTKKFNLYEKHGVREYWIVHPEEKTVMVFTLVKDSLYGRPKNYSASDKIKVVVLKGLTIDLDEIFAEK